MCARLDVRDGPLTSTYALYQGLAVFLARSLRGLVGHAGIDC